MERDLPLPGESEWEKLFDLLYLPMYAPRQPDERATEQALKAAELVSLRPDEICLDAACGFGRHAVPLARAGFRVIAVDRSASLLQEAARRGRGLDGLELVEGDYRALPLADASVDVVLNLFTSLGYYGQETDQRVLGEFRRVLRPGGRLLVDIVQRDWLVEVLQPRGWTPIADGAFVLEERSFDPVEGTIEMTETLVRPSAPAEGATYRLRVYTATELADMVRKAGFDELAFFGDFDGEPFDRFTRLVLRARAAGEQPS